jgi:hypothetical protein
MGPTFNRAFCVEFIPRILNPGSWPKRSRTALSPVAPLGKQTRCSAEASSSIHHTSAPTGPVSLVSTSTLDNSLRAMRSTLPSGRRLRISSSTIVTTKRFSGKSIPNYLITHGLAQGAQFSAHTPKGVRPYRCPLCPDSDQILRRSEMTQCDKRRPSLTRSAPINASRDISTDRHYGNYNRANQRWNSNRGKEEGQHPDDSVRTVALMAD